jgi:hypothetical protein
MKSRLSLRVASDKAISNNAMGLNRNEHAFSHKGTASSNNVRKTKVSQTPQLGELNLR